MDTGPVYGVVPSRSPRGHAGTCSNRLSRSGAELLLATMDGIEDGLLRPVPQRPRGVLRAEVTVADAEVDWRAPAAAVDRLVRSVTPDRAWSTFSAPSGSALARCVR